VALSGLSIQNENNPNGDIEIKITGLRPGEKLYEELLIGDNPSLSQHPKIMRANEDYLNWEQLHPQLDRLLQYLNNNDVEQIKLVLSELVNGYNSDSSTVDWLVDNKI
jgi:FlaA1/EpsC-like NDP-sugar epimerase